MAKLSERTQRRLRGLIGYDRRPMTRVCLTLGKLQLTKHDLVHRYGECSFIAAARLTHALERLGITTVRQLAGYAIHRLVLAGHGVGIEGAILCMHLLADHGYDAERWAAGETKDLPTIATLVRRATHERERRVA